MDAGVYAKGGSLDLPFDVKYTYPEETADGVLNFTNIQIKFKAYGIFMIYFVVDGIESNMAGIVEVQMEIPAKAEVYLYTKMEFYLVIITCALTLMTNTPYHSLKWAIFGTASCVITIVYVWMVSDYDLYKYVVSLCVMCLLIGTTNIIYDSKYKNIKK